MRRTHFSEAAEVVDVVETKVDEAAVNTTNLVSLLDPDKVGSEEVNIIADATGAKPEFVEAVVELVEDCNNGECAPEAFSRKANSICQKYKRSFQKNFSANPEDATTEVVKIVGMLDDEALTDVKETVETISDATGVSKDSVEPIVELAANSFSRGRKSVRPARKIQAFSSAENEVTPVAPTAPAADSNVPATPDKVEEVKNEDTTLLPKEAIAQDPKEAAVQDDGDSVSDAVAPAEAMAEQVDLTVVLDKNDVPTSNFSKGAQNSVGKFSVLKELLGSKYIQ